MVLLRQSTSVVISFGPFLLNTDGVTLVTNLVGTGANQTENTSTGIRIAKNGGAFAARHATATASTYDAFGNYLVTLDTTDTGTLGVLRVQFANGSAFCPVWQDFLVVPANVWDSLCSSSLLQVDLTQVKTGAVPTPNVTGVPLVDAKYLLGTVFPTPTVAGVPNVNVKTVNDVSTSPVTTIKAVQGLTTADTIATYTGNTPQTGDNYARIGAPVGVSISADIAGVQSDTDNIQTRLPASLVSGRIDSSVGAMAADVLTASAIATDAIGSAELATTAVNEIRDAILSDSTPFQGARIDASISSRSSHAAADVWAVTTRTLSSFGTLVADIATAVWAAAARTLSAFGFTVDTNANATETAIKAKTDNLPSDPADASDIAAAFSTVNGTLGTIAGYVDTEVAAIKAKTDNLPATPASTSDCITAAGVRSAVGLASANLDTQLDALPTNAELATALAGADDAVLAAVAALVIPTADQNAGALLDLSAGIEIGLTLRQAMRLIVAAEAGKLSGAATTTITIRNYGDSKDRIIATVDSNGDRSALTYDLT